MKKIFDAVNMKKLKNGSYSILLSVAVIAIVIVINLIVNELPSQYTKIDVSDQKLYTIGEQTKKLAKSLDQDVTIYYIAEEGKEDATIRQMLERYEDISSHIKVVQKDPAIYPNFSSQYTEDKVGDNSLIITCGEKNKVLQQADLYESEVNYQTYQEETTGFDGEGQLTSAISYVTTDNTPILYQVEGHGEQTISESLSAGIEKENMDIQSLNLLTQDVPEDAAAIIICAPTKDLSKEEAQKVLSYLENGGKGLIFTNYTKEDLPNFESILESYGIKTADGIVFEGDNNHYYQEPYYLIPNINSTDITADMVSEKRNVLLVQAQGIQKLDNYRDTLTIDPLITTSDSAYSKVDVENIKQYAKEDKDISGPFDLGVAVSETVGENETQLACFSSLSMIDDSVNQAVSGGNIELIMDSLSWMCKEEGTSISIPSKSLQVGQLSLTQFQISLWTIVTLILIPCACLVIGFVIWIKRRKQ